VHCSQSVRSIIIILFFFSFLICFGVLISRAGLMYWGLQGVRCQVIICCWGRTALCDLSSARRYGFCRLVLIYCLREVVDNTEFSRCRGDTNCHVSVVRCT